MIVAIEILKVVFLFITVLLTTHYTIALFAKKEILAKNIVCQAIGITGFIYLHFIM